MQGIELRVDVARPHAFRRADVLRDFHVRGIEQAAGIVLHVDDEGVDFGGIGETDELRELAPAECPCIDVQRFDRLGGRTVVEQRLGENVAQLDATQPHAVGRSRQLLRKKAATDSRGPEQDGAHLASEPHRGHQHKKRAPNAARDCVTIRPVSY